MPCRLPDVAIGIILHKKNILKTSKTTSFYVYIVLSASASIYITKKSPSQFDCEGLFPLSVRPLDYSKIPSTIP